MDKLAEGKRVFDIEIGALKKTRDALDDVFADILDLITNCKGKVIVTGMGKPGHIAGKLAATFSSLGTPSFCLHPAEAMHGDLGMVSENDIVIAISYSGESDEIVTILPNIKMIGATLVGITGNAESTLARAADVVQILPEFDEACYLGLAPTSSTTAVLCYGDALAVVASAVYGFKDVDFGKYHPAGSLGKKLLMRVRDVMLPVEETAVVGVGGSLTEAIVAMSKKGLNMVTAIDDNKIVGILTDGDLRRLLENCEDIYSLSFDGVSTKKPIVIREDSMAVDALNIMKKKRFNSMPVINEKGEYMGIVTLHSIMKTGIVA
jgi:arabinose-5-phosphate isomerase